MTMRRSIGSEATTSPSTMPTTGMRYATNEVRVAPHVPRSRKKTRYDRPDPKTPSHRIDSQATPSGCRANGRSKARASPALMTKPKTTWKTAGTTARR